MMTKSISLSAYTPNATILLKVVNMKRNLLKVFALIIMTFCLLSCTEDSEKTQLPKSNISISSLDTLTEEFYVDEDTDIELTNLEDDALYGFYTEQEGVASQARNLIGKDKFFLTNGGTYIHYSDGMPLSFSAHDIGIKGPEHIRMVKYCPWHDDYLIDTEKDVPLFRDWKGRDVYEEFYRIPIDVEDESKVAVLELQQSRSATMSTDIKIIEAGPNYWMPDENTIRGVIDLTDVDAISILNQVKISKGSTKRGVLLQTPITITQNEKINLRAPQIYEIKKTDSELVLEIELAEPLEKYSFGFSSVNSRYNEGGERKPYVFPIKYDKTSPNRALLYIGKAEEDFIFDFNMFTETYENAGVALLRPITEAERNLINFVNPSNGTVTINFTSEDYFIPIIFQGDNLSDGYIKLISPSNHKLRFTCGHKNHIGYTSISLDNGEIITPIEYSNEILECAYIINDREKEGSITLQFSKDGSFPPLYPIIESDSPTILKSNERYSILPNQKELVLEIDLGDNDFDNYDFRTNAIDSQYTDGTRRHYMFPLNYDENTNTVVLYIGTVDKEFSFPVEMHAETDNAGTATLREITEKEKEKILYINPAERRIEIYISKENLYTPIIFKGEESLLRNGYIKIEISSIDPWLQIVSGHTDRYGYSQRSIDMDENIIDRTDRPQDILEYANLYNPNGYEGNMILSFSRDGNF